ncbi:carbohydrate binding domain-containing protein [Nonomuraea turcica]|uniref:hypothetical protein n=1 Tax=Nonomuraea sp. G32 TaxID=3067274 RepID=UPI00273C160D|nr:hypothetical protein [Nonomuraea sp. G32]MDP4503291.1 hypothetical protein [Nonomuraea sp. G32]
MKPELSRRALLRASGAGAAAAASWSLLSGPAAAATARPGRPLDEVIFGDAASEAAHAVTPAGSDVVAGALGQSARVLNPQTPASAWGGTVACTVKCVPDGTTYVTIKLWGGDRAPTEADQSRLQLFCEGEQVGHYHLGAVDPLDILSLDAHAPGRFHYHTLPLPEAMTRDKEQVTLEIRAMGRVWGYGQNAAEFYRTLNKPTRPFYRIFTHKEPYFPGDGIQGPAPEAPVRPEPGPEVLETIKARVVREHRSWLGGSAASMDSWAYLSLAEGYFYPGSPAYQNPEAIDQVLAAIDARYTKWLTDPTVLTASDQQWEGFGKVGHVLVLLKDVLGDRLERKIGARAVGAPNPGFERGGTAPAGWTSARWAGTATWLWDDAVTHGGSRSVKVAADAGAVAGWSTSQNRTLIGQGKHRYSVWVRTENVAAPGAYLNVLFYDPAGKIVGTDQRVFAPTGTNDWTQITTELTTPATAVELRLDVRVHGGGTAWFDDVEVTPLAGATEPDQGDLPVRRAAYTKMMTESIAYWRRHMPHYSNQVQICALGIYRCNRGLMLINPDKAPLAEEKARDYIHQAVGLKPFLGREDASGTPSKPLGEHFYQATRKGLTKELGYVGSYGEVTCWLVLLYEAVTRFDGVKDPELEAQLVKMINARAVFRYPEVDNDGYRTMRLEAAVGWRDDHYPGVVTYAQRVDWDGHPLMASAVFDDPALVGRGQRMVGDNQFFGGLDLLQTHSWSRVGVVALRLLARDWPAFTARTARPQAFPMDWDAPSFVFTDEENGVVAIKNGQEILYACLYWRARQAVNNLARVHHITPDTHRVATLRQQCSVIPTGEIWTEQDWVCSNFAINDPAASHIPPGGFPPPGSELHQAFAGEVLKVAPHPADVPDPALGVDFPGVEKLFVGKAQFYRCSYGRYLIGMNTDGERTRRLYTTGPGTARDLGTGRQVRLGGSIEVEPLSTVVLYLED